MAFLNKGTLLKPNVQCYSARFTPSSHSDGVTEFVSLMATDHESQLHEEARRCLRQQKRYWQYKDNKFVVLNASFTRLNGYTGRKVSVLDRDSFLVCFEDLSTLKNKVLEESKLLIDEWHKQPKTVQKVAVSKEYPIKDYSFTRLSRGHYRPGKSLQTLILSTYNYTMDYLNDGAAIGPLDLKRITVSIKIQSTAMNPNGDQLSSQSRNGLHYDMWGFGVGAQTFIDMIDSGVFADFRRRIVGWTGVRLGPNLFGAKQALVNPQDKHTWAEHIKEKVKTQNKSGNKRKEERELWTENEEDEEAADVVAAGANAAGHDH